MSSQRHVPRGPRRGPHTESGHGTPPRGVRVRSHDRVELEVLRLRLLVDGAQIAWRGPQELHVEGASVELIGDRARELGVPVDEIGAQ